MCLGVWWALHICLCPFSQLWGTSQGKWKDVPTETEKQLPEYIWALNESVIENIQWDMLEVSSKAYPSVRLFLFLEVVLAPGWWMMVVTLHVSHGFDILSVLADFMCFLLQHNGACGYLACV